VVGPKRAAETEGAPPERTRVLELVQRHGWNATAFQTLESGYVYAFFGDDACVAYVDTGAAFVAAGAPIAPPERIGTVAAEFVALAAEAGRRCCFFATEERFQRAAAALSSLRIGEQPIWDPGEWRRILSEHPSLREQLRRARAKGVRVRQVAAAEFGSGELRAALARVTERWLATRDLARLDFLVRIEALTFPEHRRCLVAELEGQVIGFAGVVPVPAREGWFLEDLIRDPDAPNGTSELLVDAVMSLAHASGVSWLTLGLAPLAGDVGGPLRAARRGTTWFYDFQGLRRYREKLRPQSWIPIYLAFPRTQGALRSLADALSAFTNGGFLRFGLRTLVRGPLSLLRLLALLLPAWMLLLALAPTAHWFGSAWIKWGWIAFDGVLVLGLVRLLRKPSDRLFTVLAVAVSLDTVVTWVEAFDVARRVEGAMEHSLLFLACAAPAVAAFLLWGARRTRLRAV
jgi:phosphatidylglycerol lysyltransferase